MREIDHIVLAVKDLAAGMKTLSEKLGCKVNKGGQHLNNGTHNALINLGSNIYLELIAPDPDNTAIPKPRWMGVDIIDEPTVTRWAIKSTELTNDLAALKSYNPALAASFEGSRKKDDGSTLHWHMALPLPAPAVEIAPFMVDWKDSVHPTHALPEVCKLLDIEFHSQDPDQIQLLFDSLQIDHKVLPADKAEIKLKIDSPNGVIEL